MQVSFTQAEVAAIACPSRTTGATTETIRGIASLGSAVPGDISFLGNPKYKSSVASTRASMARCVCFSACDIGWLAVQ